MQSQSQSQSQSQAARSDARAQLTHAAERELRDALTEQERPLGGMYLKPSRQADAALDRAVREVCSEAHRLDLRAEELLVAVKQAWSQLAPVRARHLGDRDGDVLRDVVSTSIEVFFEPMERGSN
jgi:hypothetical protein